MARAGSPCRRALAELCASSRRGPVALSTHQRTSSSAPAAIHVSNVQIVGSAGALPAGLVTADQTLVATSSTGDVRGTYIPGTLNGTARTVVFHQAPIAQAKVSTNIDFRGLIGVVQA